MKRESTENLRRRLLQEEQVQIMISMRAYEIYKMRGSEPGHDAEDWFRAENEILYILDTRKNRAAKHIHTSKIRAAKLTNPNPKTIYLKRLHRAKKAARVRKHSSRKPRLRQPTGSISQRANG